ncbi:hypothetical protein VS884_26125, partial [Escherichia coli]
QASTLKRREKCQWLLKKFYSDDDIQLGKSCFIGNCRTSPLNEKTGFNIKTERKVPMASKKILLR